MADSVYLVLVHVDLLSNRTVSAVDVFEAESPDEARNMALNTFLRAPENTAVVYGDRVIYPEAIGTLNAEVLAEIDIEAPFHQRWKDAIEVMKKHLEQLDKNHEQGYRHLKDTSDLFPG